jgi:hypothetical protein
VLTPAGGGLRPSPWCQGRKEYGYSDFMTVARLKVPLENKSVV